MSPTPHHGARRLAGLMTRLGLTAALLLAFAAPLIGTLIGPAVESPAGAQTSASGAPLGLSAPAWSSPDVPAEMRISSLWVLPGPDGSPASVDVRFAGPFTPPAGRWRVSVGVGDPSGGWQRVSMVWDGAAATGVAEQIEGLAVVELGPVTVSVNPSGSVIVGVPAGVLDAAGGGLVWAEAVLGPDTEPTLLVRTPWFPRAVLAGEGAPGLLQGSTLGVPVPAEPGGAAPNAAPPVVDTGVPSVLELNGGVLSIDRGAGPAVVPDGGVASVVDLVTLVDAVGSAEALPSGPQVRIDLLGGGVELGVGSVLGPLGPPVGDDVVAPPSAAWLQSAGDAGGASGSAPVEVVVAGAFAETGQSDPGDRLAVTVTRVVTGADGSVVAAPGVLADRAWLQPAAELSPVATAPPEGVGAEGGEAPVLPIVVGTVLGVVLVGGAMALAGQRHRRRHPGPGNRLPSSVTASASATGTASASSPARTPQAAPAAPVAPPAPVAPAAPDAPAAPATPAPAPQPPPAAGAVGGLDEDIDELAERLRRLDDKG